MVSRSFATRDAPGQTQFLRVERFRLQENSLTKSNLSFQFVKTINMATLDYLFRIAVELHLNLSFCALSGARIGY